MIEEIKSTTTQSEAVDQQQACSVLPVASCAHRLFLSPHEWTWTQAEQEEMAREIIRLGNAIKLAAPLLREIHAHPARNGPIQVAAGKLMAALGITQNTERSSSPADGSSPNNSTEATIMRSPNVTDTTPSPGCREQRHCSPLSVDEIALLRADYDRLRLLDSALALCGGNQGPAHAVLKARVEAKLQQIGMGNWKFLELCKKCRGTGYLYADYSLPEQSKCRCYDGYVLPANDQTQQPHRA